MWRAAICICAALVLGSAGVSRAQYNDNDRQDPKEYTDEDSQPLAIVGYIASPIGYALEWLVARPIHYVAKDSPASPAFDPLGGNQNSPPPPIPIIPDNSLRTAAERPVPREWSPSHAPAAAPTNGSSYAPLTGTQAGAASSGSQPALH